MLPGPSNADAFIEYWSKAEASERANAQPFLIALADLLGVPHPAHSHTTGYSFEFPVHIPTLPASHPPSRIDLYRRGHFVLEAKQFIAPQPEQTELTLAAVAASAARPKNRNVILRKPKNSLTRAESVGDF